MCEYLEEEIEELKAEVKQKSEQINTWRRLWVLKGNTVRELRATLSNTKAELSVVRSDLADTAETLDNYRDTHVKSSRINSELRKDVADTKAELSIVRSNLADTTRTLDECREMLAKVSKDNLALTEERDLAFEMFQGLAYIDLLDRYAKKCDDYDALVSHVDAEHGKF